MVRTVDGSEPGAGSLEGGTAGQVPYQTAPDTTSFVGPGTAGQVLTSNGAAAPSYQTISAGAISPTYTVYSSGSGTYNTPTDCSYIIVEMCGGGGGGAATNAVLASQGGGGAAYVKLKFAPGSYSYAVGAAGVGSVGTGTGTAGGNTTFGSSTAFGGAGGTNTQSTPTSSAGYSTTGASLVILGIQGGRGSTACPTISPGGTSFWSNATWIYQGANVQSIQSTSFGYGGGGGGITTNNWSPENAGNGDSGRIFITEYY